MFHFSGQLNFSLWQWCCVFYLIQCYCIKEGCNFFMMIINKLHQCHLKLRFWTFMFIRSKKYYKTSVLRLTLGQKTWYWSYHIVNLKYRSKYVFLSWDDLNSESSLSANSKYWNNHESLFGKLVFFITRGSFYLRVFLC